MYTCLLLSVFALASASLNDLSNQELVAMVSGQPTDDPINEEMRTRLKTYPAPLGAELATLLMDAVEHSAVNVPTRFEYSITLAIATRHGPLGTDTSGRNVVIPHMRRIIVEGDPSKVSVIMAYVEALTRMDQSEDTEAALLSLLGKKIPDPHGDLNGEILVGMGRLGDRGQHFLINYMPKNASETTLALGQSGGRIAFRYLRKQARKHDGKVRTQCTFALGTWALTKPMGSPDRAKAVRTLQSLACDHTADVKTVALAALTRIESPAPTRCGRDLDRQDDEHEDDEDHGHHR